MIAALALSACSTEQKAKVSDVALDEPERRAEMMEAMLRVMDQHPEYVDELFRLARRHPKTLDRFLEVTARANLAAAILVDHPKQFATISKAIVEEAMADPNTKGKLKDLVKELVK